MKCKICGRRVLKGINRRFHWVEEQMCGLCFYGRMFNYINSLNSLDKGTPMIAR